MTPERWQQIDQLLDAALACEESQRADLVAKSCQNDEALRREVESLLASHRQAETFIESPASSVAAKLLAESESPSLVSRTLGRYRILSLLSTGGMGQVYRAQDASLGREVAIKVLPEHCSHEREVLAGFEQEAKVLGALSHPNILAIHDFGTEQGNSFAVQELLQGETLRALLGRAAMPWRQGVEIATGIAEGLAAAHSKEIIHLDLKPENIFLTSDGQVKILDFGLARLKLLRSADEKATAAPINGTPTPGLLRGTPGYISPEQLNGEVPTSSSDIFSFGCVLYEMLTGKRPFAGETVADTLVATITDEPPSFSQSGRQIPADLKRVALRCLEKDTKARFQSGRELAVELRALRSRSGVSNRLSPGGARHPVRLAVWLGVLLVLLVVISAPVYWNQHRHSTSLLVLPLSGGDGDAETELLSGGMAESIINGLSQAPDLRVLAYRTSRRYKNRGDDFQTLGRDLGVANIVTVRTQHREDVLLVQATLVNVADGTQVWGERYSQKLTDVFTVQTEIAEIILDKLRLKLTRDERRMVTKQYTASAQAYDSYFRGRYFWNTHTKKGLKKAIKYFEQAIEIDPSYALAYAGLADSYSISARHNFLPAQEALPLAERYAMKALSLDETLAEAHAALGRLEADRGHDLAAEKELKRALGLNPNYACAHHWYSNLLGHLGRRDEQLAELKRAQELDPGSPAINSDLGSMFYLIRQYDEAITQLQKTIEMHPGFPKAHLEIIGPYEQEGRYDEAMAELQQVLSLTGDRVAYKMGLGHWYAMSGQRTEALRTAEELEELRTRERVSAAGIAIIYAGLEEIDQALGWLARAYQEEGSLVWNELDPRFDNLRSDARFSDLVQGMKHKH